LKGARDDPNDDAQEIHAKLLEVQDFLTSNLEWAAAQAAQSRTRADAEQSSNTAQTAAPAPAAATASQGQGQGQASDVHLASNNPFAAVLSGDVPISALTESNKSTTEEEDILSEILTATPEVRRLLAVSFPER
jgi:hypothetical protein